MAFPHTHVLVDGHLHVVHRVEEHADGPGHTHRAHLGCGLTVDADFRGARHAARADERRAMAAAAPHPIERDEHLRHAACLDAATLRHRADHDDASGRWRRAAAGAATCPRCAEVESGAAPRVVDHGCAPATTVEADAPTGLRCPSCDALIYRRRRAAPDDPRPFACAGLGHAFGAAELLAHAEAGLRGLLDAVGGSVIGGNAAPAGPPMK